MTAQGLRATTLHPVWLVNFLLKEASKKRRHLSHLHFSVEMPNFNNIFEECYHSPSQFIDVHLQKEKTGFSSSRGPVLRGSQVSFGDSQHYF